VVITTGGGTDIFPMLLRRGGGSATLLSGLVPYGVEDTCELLGGRPDKVVSREVARGLAMVAWQKARRRCPDGPVLGLAATSVLQKVPSERGGRAHAIYAALQADDRMLCAEIEYDDPAAVLGVSGAAAVRAAEEELCALVMLRLLSGGCGLAVAPALPGSAAGRLVEGGAALPGGVAALIGGGAPVRLDFADGGWAAAPDAPPPTALLPGSFNPAHAGHMAMAAEAERLLGARPVFEIALRNADKPPIDPVSLERRLSSLAAGGARSVVLTDAPTFVEKAGLFPGAVFAVGWDTAARVADPRYYGGEDGRDAAVARLSALGASFLVFGRRGDDGEFRDGLGGLPPAFAALCRAAEGFRVDASSTALRRAGA